MKVKAHTLLPGQLFNLGSDAFLRLEDCDYAEILKEADGLSEQGFIAVDMGTATLVCFEGTDDVEI